MVARKDIDGSASVPAFYGKELRWKREDAGLTLQQAIAGSFYGVSYLSEIERGHRRMPLDLAAHIDRVLRTDGFFARRCEDVRKARTNLVAPYFQDAFDMETRARDIQEWSPMLLPGPLQLEPYIREMIHTFNPKDGEAEVARKVASRRTRTWVFEEPEGPASWVVLDESILRNPVVSDQVMAEQLEHIAAVAHRRHYVPQILPWNAGAHPFMMGSTLLMTFGDEPPVMYTEGMYSGQLIDDPGIVEQYQQAYNRLRAAALPPKTSLKMIEDAAEDFANGNHARRLERRQLAHEQLQHRPGGALRRGR
ncbi:helix-turn-helix transcriptional regulator [Streptomyces sp. H27-H1]|uniref:helix-turn-helix domain-containing protein n=1 Tax=Streptomyces sp. H27-H1 TaxID=2996461 RepID=UPI00226D8F65|nr:helix-turn-helix transcriptional regulator [Streptomyces sp. H27-H1]MCY0932365.1 helix-turn-helix transcriptional regulator [Streptomyces sp. H27-H1]